MKFEKVKSFYMYVNKVKTVLTYMYQWYRYCRIALQTFMVIKQKSCDVLPVVVNY